MMEQVDLVIVGAGIHGLAMAKTYLEVNPSADILILDSASSIGGVWAEDRLYPELMSNNRLGTYEFSDFPMNPEIFGIKPGEHIPADVMHNYLTYFAERFDLISRIRFETKVNSAEYKGPGKWLIKVTRGFIDDNPLETDEVSTNRLVIATGLTSEPFLPNLPGSELFDAPLFHSRDFLRNEGIWETTKKVAVLGGGKSAWDIVYAYASRGIQVDWIIRESGHGPTWMTPPKVPYFNMWLEKLVHLRLLTWLSPCIWGDADGYLGVRKFLHRTSIGRILVAFFWWVLGNGILTQIKYNAHSQTKKLRPWIDLFWVASGLSIFNYPRDGFEFFKKGTVKVHIADIKSLGPKSIHLSNGPDLAIDALICATGWRRIPPISFLPLGLEARLGIPFQLSSKSDSGVHELVSRADREILTKFPRLERQPQLNPAQKQSSKSKDTSASAVPEEDIELYRLYRFMVPPSFLESRDIAFAGALMTLSTTLCAQTQALWITAFMSPAPSISPLHDRSLAEIEYETILHSRFGRWRSPGGSGACFPDFAYDALPYLDMLLRDLDLRVWRKGNAWSEIVEPYGPADYRKLVAEWMDGRRGRQRGNSAGAGPGRDRKGNAKLHVE